MEEMILRKDVVVRHCLIKTGMSMHFSTTIPRTIPLLPIAPRQTLSLTPDTVSEMFQLLHQVDEIDCGTSHLLGTGNGSVLDLLNENVYVWCSLDSRKQ